MSSDLNEKATAIFNQLDTDNDGIINQDDLVALLGEEAEDCMEILDPDGHGTIDFKMFLQNGAHLFGGGDDDDDDDDDDLDAEFDSDLDDDDEEIEDENSPKNRMARYKKIMTWSKQFDTVEPSDLELALTHISGLKELPKNIMGGIKDLFKEYKYKSITMEALTGVLEQTWEREENRSQEAGNKWSGDEWISGFMEILPTKMEEKGSGGAILTVEEENTALHRELNELRETYASTKEKLEHAKTDAGRLDDENQRLKNESDAWQGAKARQEEEKEQAAATIQSFKEMMSQTNKEMAKCEKALKDQTQAHQNTKALLGVEKKIKKKTKAELKLLKQKLGGLEAAHGELHQLVLKKKAGKMTAIMARRTYIRSLQVEVDKIPQLIMENNRLCDKVTQMEEEAKGYLRVMDSYRDDKLDGEQVNMPHSAPVKIGLVMDDKLELEELRKKVARLLEETDDLKNQLEDEKRQREEAETEVERLNGEVDTLGKKIITLEEEIIKLQKEAEDEKEKHRNEVEDLNAKIKELEDRIAELERQLKESNALRGQLEQQIKDMGSDEEARIQELMKEIAKLKIKIHELEESLGSETKAKEDTQDQLSKTKDHLANEKKRTSRLEGEVARLKGELAEALQKIKDLEEVLKDHEAEVVTIIEAKVHVEPPPVVEQVVEIKLDLNAEQQAELTAYSLYFNQQLAKDKDLSSYFPLNVEDPSLLTKITDGIMLTKMINKCVPGTVDVRAMNIPEDGEILTAEQIQDNIKLCLGAAKSIGIRFDMEKTQEQIMDCSDPDVVLKFLYEIVRCDLFQMINLDQHPECMDLCENPETGLSSLKLKEYSEDQLKAMAPEKLLLRWVNWHRIGEAQGELDGGIIKKWGDGCGDSIAFSSILTKIAEVEGEADMMPDTSRTDGKRARHVLDKAKKLGINHFHRPMNITSGNSRLCMLFAASIFNHRTGIEEDEEMIQARSGNLKADALGGSVGILTSEMREERAYRMWINSLQIPKVFINNLFLDSRNGLVLLKVLEKLEPGVVDWKKVEKKPKTIFKQSSNCEYFLKLCNNPLGIKTTGIGGNDLAKGSQNLLLAIVWQIVRYQTNKQLKLIFTKLGYSNNTNPDEAILTWANNKIKENPCKEKKVAPLKSFKDKKISTGIYLIALLWAIQPRVVRWKVVKDGSNENDKLQNASYAISVARKMGAELFLLPFDIVEVKPQAITLFVAAIMIAAAN